MWQRIQTLYLILAIAGNAVLFRISFMSIRVGEITYSFNMQGLVEDGTSQMIFPTIILLVFASITILLSVLVLINFKKRQLQIKLGRFNFIAQLAFIAALFFISDMSIHTNLKDVNLGEVSYELGTFLIIPPLIFIYLAIRNIKSDEELVRAADRIR